MEVDAFVFLVDDDPGARKSLGFLIESSGYSVKSFTSANEFLDYYLPHHRGCLVLDIRMPGMSGLELQERLREGDIQIPIIFVSGHTDVAIASRAFRAGACDVIEKPIDEQTLLRRIHEAMEKDERWQALRVRRSEFENRLSQLTPREREIFEHIVEGKSVKQMAGHFQISFQTAAKHRARILRKMEVSNDVELVRLVASIKSAN